MTKLNTLKVENYNIDKTLKSGQVFVWDKEGDTWFGKTVDGLITLKQTEPNEILWQTYPELNREGFIRKYFRTDFIYEDFIEICSSDSNFFMTLEQLRELRLLSQNFYETTISFIISTNKNITSIKTCIKKLSELFGEKVIVNDKEYFLFPSIEKIANASIVDLRSCSLGYRAEYVKVTAQTLNEDNKWKEIVKSDEDSIRNSLLALKGVGNKVADCILCYSLGFDNVTPLDVWGQRILNRYYGVDPKLSYRKKREWVQQNFHGYAAWVGQYLFEYIRQMEKER